MRHTDGYQCDSGRDKLQPPAKETQRWSSEAAPLSENLNTQLLIAPTKNIKKKQPQIVNSKLVSPAKTTILENFCTNEMHEP